MVRKNGESGMNVLTNEEVEILKEIISMSRTKGGWMSVNNKLVCSVCGASFKKLSIDKFMQCPRCFSQMGILIRRDDVIYKRLGGDNE